MLRLKSLFQISEAFETVNAVPSQGNSFPIVSVPAYVIGYEKDILLLVAVSFDL